MRSARILVVAAVLAALLAVPALAARPAALLDAVVKQYGVNKVHIDKVCFKGFRGRGYALVNVSYLKNQKGSLGAYQFFKVAGWAGMWRDGKVLRRVAKAQRPRVRAAVKYLKFACP